MWTRSWRGRTAHSDDAVNAERALSKDTVPVNVDAVIFWQVHDAESALESSTTPRRFRAWRKRRCAKWWARPCLHFAVDRKQGDEYLPERDRPAGGGLGVAVLSVEIRDVSIPAALRIHEPPGPSERERQARVIWPSRTGSGAEIPGSGRHLCAEPGGSELRP